MTRNSIDREAKFSKLATRALSGLTVKKVRYMSAQEVSAYDWYSQAPIIEFTDGTYLIASMDEEGNGAGALFTNAKGLHGVIPTI